MSAILGRVRAPDITLKQLSAFVAVAEAGGFTAAADTLYVSQSVLSRTIAALERSVGGPLFNREARQLRLTPLGEDLLRAGRRVLGSHEDAMWEVDQFAAGRRGTVRVAAMPSVAHMLLPTTISRYRRTHPGVAVRLHEGPAARVHKLFDDESVEIGMTWQQNASPPKAGVSFTPMVTDRIVAVVSKSDPLADLSEITWTELAEHPLVSLAADASSRRLTDRTLESIGAAQSPMIEVGSAATVGVMVAAGLGVAAMSGLVTGLLGESVVTIPLVEPEVFRTVCVFWRDSEVGPASRQFIDEVARVKNSGIVLPPHVAWAE